MRANLAKNAADQSVMDLGVSMPSGHRPPTAEGKLGIPERLLDLLADKPAMRRLALWAMSAVGALGLAACTPGVATPSNYRPVPIERTADYPGGHNGASVEPQAQQALSNQAIGKMMHAAKDRGDWNTYYGLKSELDARHYADRYARDQAKYNWGYGSGQYRPAYGQYQYGRGYAPLGGLGGLGGVGGVTNLFYRNSGGHSYYGFNTKNLRWP